MRGSRVDVSGENFFELVERGDPSALVAVTRGSIEQLLVMYGQQRAVAIRLQRHRHLRFAFRRRVPGPAEHQTLVRHHLAIGPADFVIFGIGGEADAKTPADFWVDVGLKRVTFGVRTPEPLDYFLRVGPRGVDFRRGGIEAALEGEAWPRRAVGGGGNIWLGGHGSFSIKAARWSRFSDQKRW